jgi:hypothetical protein
MALVFRTESRLPIVSTPNEKSTSITAVKASKHLRRYVRYVVTEAIRVMINEYDDIEHDGIYLNMGLQTFFIYAQVYC